MRNAVVLLLFLTTVCLSAGPEEWVPNGPYGALIGSFVFNPDQPKVIVGGGSWGIERSTDGGTTWTRIFYVTSDSFGFPVRHIPDQRNGFMFASNVVGISKDSGETWTILNSNPTGHGDFFIDFEFVPNDLNQLFAVSEHTGVYKSTDRGVSWKAVNSGIHLSVNRHPARAPGLYFDIPQLEIDPRNPRNVYVLWVDRKLYKSSNAGVSWTAHSISEASEASVHSLVIDPAYPSTLYVGREDGLFRSTDGGIHWSATSLKSDIVQVAVDPQNPTRVYAAGDGFFRSLNGGVTWKRANVPGCNDQFLSFGVSPDGASLVMSGDGQGIFHSANQGRTWKYAGLNDVLFEQEIYQLATFNNGKVVAVSYPEAYETTSNGRTWNLFVKSASPTKAIDQIRIHPQDENLIYAIGKPPVVKSTDGGKTWRKVGPFSFARGFALDPENKNRIFVLPSDRQVSESTDQGLTWQSLASLPAGVGSVIRTHPENPQILYAGTDQNGKLFRSTDGGMSWEEWSSKVQGQHVVDLIIDRQRSQTMYLLEERYRGPIDTTAVGRIDKQPLIYKTTDGGATWKLKNSGLHPVNGISCLILDPRNSQTIFAGGEGIYRSTNGGDHWTILFGSDNLHTHDLAFSSDFKFLLAATNRGVVAYRLP